jgi:aspartate/methionine/tyrosine aminotransferase
MDLAMKLIEEAKIGFTPGSAFGSLGEGHMRFSYATSRENITEGLNRLEEFVKKL